MVREPLSVLAEKYPHASRRADAQRLGISPSTLGCYVYGTRVPGERAAQRISSDLNGLLTVAELRGWVWGRPASCRFFPTDPMPMHRAELDELPTRDRYSDADAVRYLRSLAPTLPPEERAAAELLIEHLGDPAEETAR